MSIFNNMFGNNNQIPNNPQSAVLGILENMRLSGKITNEQYNSLMQRQNQIPINPQSAVLGMLENMRSSGKLTDAQYSSLMQNQNNPQEMVQVILQNGLFPTNK